MNMDCEIYYKCVIFYIKYSISAYFRAPEVIIDKKIPSNLIVLILTILTVTLVQYYKKKHERGIVIDNY